MQAWDEEDLEEETMEKNRIEEIKYEYTYFDNEVGEPTRVDFLLSEDGAVEYRVYRAGVRKCIEKVESKKATAEEYGRLCLGLEACIAAADRMNWFVDDHDAEITLHRSFGRIDTMMRGYGTESSCVGDLVWQYLHDAAGMEFK